MTSTSVFVPGSTGIIVKGFTNAYYTQRITVTPPAGSSTSSFTLQGSGEGNDPLGVTHFTTPAGDDLEVSIDMEYSPDGNSWQSPELYSSLCSINDLQLYVAVAEDGVDEDYNDAVCIVSWVDPDEALAAGGARPKQALCTAQTLGSTVVTLYGPTQPVNVESYVNANYLYQVSMTPGGQQSRVWSGQGLYDVPLGSTSLPPSKSDLDVTVAISYSLDGGSTWTQSQVGQAACEIGNYRIVVVASDDVIEGAHNMTTTYFI